MATNLIDRGSIFVLSTSLAQYISMDLTTAEKLGHARPGLEDVTIANMVYRDDTVEEGVPISKTPPVVPIHAINMMSRVAKVPRKKHRLFVSAYEEYVKGEGYDRAIVSQGEANLKALYVFE